MSQLRRRLSDMIEREASRREIYATAEEAGNFGLADYTVFAQALRHLYQVRKVLVISTSANHVNDVLMPCGYRYRHGRYQPAQKKADSP